MSKKSIQDWLTTYLSDFKQCPVITAHIDYFCPNGIAPEQVLDKYHLAISLFGFLVEAALERNLTEEFKPVMTVGLVNNQSLDRWDSKNLNTDLCPEHIPIIGILKREWAEPYIPFQDGECYTQNITLNLPAALQNNTKVIYKCSRPLNDIDIDEGFFRQLDFEFYPDSLIMRF